MKLRHLTCILSFVLLAGGSAAFAADEKPLVDSTKVIPLTRFLEEQPFHESAPLARAELLRWEEKTKDVAVIVCPGVLEPLPSPDLKYGNELLVQFIFGSAAYQLANPADKGVLLPGQLAGMRSILAAYRSMLAHDPKARIARFDELVQKEADGTFVAEIEKSVAANCSMPPK